MAWLRGALKSWTVWFNTVLALALADLSSDPSMILTAMPQLQSYLPEHWYRYAMGILTVGNLLLRIKTNSSLADKGKGK